MPRHILHPGKVQSKNDGQIHYITAPVLARLYGLDYKICFVIYDDQPTSRGIVKRSDDIHYYPRYDGKYPTVQ